MKHLYIHIFCIAILFLAVSCSNDGKKEDLAVCTHRITVLFSPGGLGDMGYNDQILRGLQTIKKERSEAELQFYSPSTLDEAEVLFQKWQNSKEESVKQLFIFASSDFESVAKKYLTSSSDENKEVLLFESSNADNLPLHHFRISMYGASYLAGITAAATPTESALILLGNSNDAPIQYAAAGFKDGFADGGKQQTETVSLAEDWTGFAKADEVYQKMQDWAMNHAFVFPVAGGSNSGVYRYMREYPRGIYTAGMDVDQSALCTQIVGSVVKHIDRLIIDCLNQWIDKGTFPETTVYGLESGYIDWMLAPDYEEVFGEIVAPARNVAIEKEKAYEGNIQ